jgi:hypothetical protein
MNSRAKNLRENTCIKFNLTHILNFVFVLLKHLNIILELFFFFYISLCIHNFEKNKKEYKKITYSNELKHQTLLLNWID